MGGDNVVWSFGFGSNMDVEALRLKKGIIVLDHVAAVARGFRLSFALKGLPLVEPSWAVAVADKASEIHGVAFAMSAADSARLDRMEGAYAKSSATFAGYDGRQLNGFLYTRSPTQLAPADIPCSARYMRVLIKGAKQAGLREDYIEWLRSMRVYQPSPQTLAARKDLPSLDELPAVSVDELAAQPMDGPHVHLSVLGYVLRVPRDRQFFRSHRGRDITARQLRQWRGLPLDQDDDLGRPPYPDQATVSEDELEFVWNWLDHYYVHCCQSDIRCVVGFLGEFKAAWHDSRS